MNWQYFVLGIIAWQIIKMLAQSINREVIERRQKRFLKMVSVMFPDKEKIAFISIDSSDKRAMAKLERQVREQFDLTDEETRED